jgi:hypothetical protein
MGQSNDRKRENSDHSKGEHDGYCLGRLGKKGVLLRLLGLNEIKAAWPEMGWEKEAKGRSGGEWRRSNG